MRRLYAYLLILLAIALAPKTGAGAATVIGLTVALLMWAEWPKVGRSLGWRVSYLAGGATILASFATARLLGDVSRIALYVGIALVASSMLVPMMLPYLRRSLTRRKLRRLGVIKGPRSIPEATHLTTVVIAFALMLPHSLDAAFWHKEPHGTVLLPILAVLAIATVVAYPRIGTQARSAVTGVLAVLAVIPATRDHITHFLTGNVEPIDYSGIGLFVGALLLVYVADRNTAVSSRALSRRTPTHRRATTSRN